MGVEGVVWCGGCGVGVWCGWVCGVDGCGEWVAGTAGVKLLGSTNV